MHRRERTVPDDRLLFQNTMRVNVGELDAYRAAIDRAVAFAVREGPQLLVDVFIDEAARRAHSFQLYADSAAVLRHWALSDPYFQGVMEHCVVERFEVYGSPDAQVLAGLRGSGMDVAFLPRLVGFLRGGTGGRAAQGPSGGGTR
jgi:hypothetical protein